MASPDVVTCALYLWWFSIPLSAILGFRIWRSGLYRKYRLFFANVVWSALSKVVLAAAALAAPSPAHSFDIDQPYFWAWVVLNPLSLGMSVLVVLELYSLVFGEYEGLSTASRWGMFTAVGISVGISVLMLPLDLKNQAPATWLRGTLLQSILILNRGVMASLVVFLLLIALFLFWWPVPLCRNLILHCFVFSSLFFSQAATQLVRNMQGYETTALVNLVLQCAGILCLLVWIFWFTPLGEMRKARVRGSIPAGREAALVAQLAGLNATLLRATHLDHK